MQQQNCSSSSSRRQPNSGDSAPIGWMAVVTYKKQALHWTGFALWFSASQSALGAFTSRSIPVNTRKMCFKWYRVEFSLFDPVGTGSVSIPPHSGAPHRLSRYDSLMLWGWTAPRHLKITESLSVLGTRLSNIQK